MGIDKITASIRNRLSLRPPQEESLNILANLSNKLSLAKNSPPVLGGDTGVVNNLETTMCLNSELEKVIADYPTCTDFERSFPSICFALAPNLTIYKKLIDDFSINCYLLIRSIS